MSVLDTLLVDDSATPRLTVYNEKTGARLDFSAATLDNWACKVGNMLIEEFDLDGGDEIGIDLPVGWQPVVIALGALAAGVSFSLGAAPSAASLHFAAPDRVDASAPYEVALVTDDPFGRGVVETGGVVPAGMVDFGPTVRAYGDQFGYPYPLIEDVIAPEFDPGARVMSTGWNTTEQFVRAALAPLAGGGSSVVVTGTSDSSRLAEIAREENVTATA